MRRPAEQLRSGHLRKEWIVSWSLPSVVSARSIMSVSGPADEIPTAWGNKPLYLSCMGR